MMSKSNMKLVPLCRCNNCMIVYEDDNPQVDAQKFKVPKNTPKLEDKKCPECEDDGYLSDVGLQVNVNHIVDDEMHVLSKLLTWCDKGIEDSKEVGDKFGKKLFVHFKKTIYKFLGES